MLQEGDSTNLECSMLSDTVHKQQGGTCYAHAIATVLASAERRIEGRIPKDHWTIVSEIIQEYDLHKGNVPLVVRSECEKRQLRFKRIRNIQKAKYWIKKKHALLAVFYLSESQWPDLHQFLKGEPHNVMTMNHLCGSQTWSMSLIKRGHAVAIGGYDEKENCWIIKNSWGKDSGDNGYWRVSVDNGLKFTFYHVYFRLEDLNDIDIFNYINKHGSNDEIQAELHRREKVKEFEKRYSVIIYRKISNKLFSLFAFFRILFIPCCLF